MFPTNFVITGADECSSVGASSLCVAFVLSLLCAPDSCALARHADDTIVGEKAVAEFDYAPPKDKKDHLALTKVRARGRRSLWFVCVPLLKISLSCWCVARTAASLGGRRRVTGCAGRNNQHCEQSHERVVERRQRERCGERPCARQARFTRSLTGVLRVCSLAAPRCASTGVEGLMPSS